MQDIVAYPGRYQNTSTGHQYTADYTNWVSTPNGQGTRNTLPLRKRSPGHSTANHTGQASSFSRIYHHVHPPMHHHILHTEASALLGDTPNLSPLRPTSPHSHPPSPTPVVLNSIQQTGPPGPPVAPSGDVSPRHSSPFGKPPSPCSHNPPVGSTCSTSVEVCTTTSPTTGREAVFVNPSPLSSLMAAPLLTPPPTPPPLQPVTPLPPPPHVIHETETEETHHVVRHRIRAARRKKEELQRETVVHGPRYDSPRLTHLPFNTSGYTRDTSPLPSFRHSSPHCHTHQRPSGVSPPTRHHHNRYSPPHMVDVQPTRRMSPISITQRTHQQRVATTPSRRMSGMTRSISGSSLSSGSVVTTEIHKRQLRVSELEEHLASLRDRHSLDQTDTRHWDSSSLIHALDGIQPRISPVRARSTYLGLSSSSPNLVGMGIPRRLSASEVDINIIPSSSSTSMNMLALLNENALLRTAAASSISRPPPTSQSSNNVPHMLSTQLQHLKDCEDRLQLLMSDISNLSIGVGQLSRNRKQSTNKNAHMQTLSNPTQTVQQQQALNTTRSSSPTIPTTTLPAHPTFGYNSNISSVGGSQQWAFQNSDTTAATQLQNVYAQSTYALNTNDHHDGRTSPHQHSPHSQHNHSPKPLPMSNSAQRATSNNSRRRSSPMPITITGDDNVQQEDSEHHNNGLLSNSTLIQLTQQTAQPINLPKSPMAMYNGQQQVDISQTYTMTSSPHTPAAATTTTTSPVVDEGNPSFLLGGIPSPYSIGVHHDLFTASPTYVSTVPQSPPHLLQSSSSSSPPQYPTYSLCNNGGSLPGSPLASLNSSPPHHPHYQMMASPGGAGGSSGHHPHHLRTANGTHYEQQRMINPLGASPSCFTIPPLLHSLHNAPPGAQQGITPGIRYTTTAVGRGGVVVGSPPSSAAVRFDLPFGNHHVSPPHNRNISPTRSRSSPSPGFPTLSPLPGAAATLAATITRGWPMSTSPPKQPPSASLPHSASMPTMVKHPLTSITNLPKSPTTIQPPTTPFGPHTNSSPLRLNPWFPRR